MAFSWRRGDVSLRPSRRVCEVHLHLAYKPSVIGAILSSDWYLDPCHFDWEHKLPGENP